MRFSRFAGVSLVPVLARLVLAAAFIPTGFHKVFDTTIFEGPPAGVLAEMGIGGPPRAETRAASPAIRLAALQDDPGAEDPEAKIDAAPPAAPPAGQPVAPETPPVPRRVVAPPATDGGEAIVAPEPSPPAPVEARAVHGVTATLVLGGWPREWKPDYMAWIAALTELVGGALILLGLFSRVWGLGLAIAMGFAFYLTSMHNLVDPGLFALGAGADGYAPFNMLVGQLGLFVLALGVCLTGPGPLSLDRLLFRRRGATPKEAVTAASPARSYRVERRADDDDDDEDEGDAVPSGVRPL